MKSQHFSDGVKWEEKVGYSRAVRMGNLIEVSGTTAFVGVELIGKNDPFKQADVVLGKILLAVAELGGQKEDIIRTRIFVKNISDWQEIGKAHHAYFHTIKPATSMLEVNAFIDPEILVEIEATAFISNEL